MSAARDAVLLAMRAWHGEAVHGERGEHVAELQRALIARGLTVGEVDGLYGPMTEAGITEALTRPQPRTVGTRPPRASGDVAHSITRYDEPGGFDLRTVADGGPLPVPSRADYKPDRPRPPRVLVLHWTAGPATAEGLHRSFSKSDRQVSSHYAIDPTGTYQYLPDEFWAYHAGWINRAAIGIDICQPIRAVREKDAIEAGYNVTLQMNPSHRGGFQRVLSLDPEVAEATRQLVFALCEKHGIDLRVPRRDDGKVDHDVVFGSLADLNDWSGVLGHHHVSNRKWDIAPWWGELFDGTVLGD